MVLYVGRGWISGTTAPGQSSPASWNGNNGTQSASRLVAERPYHVGVDTSLEAPIMAITNDGHIEKCSAQLLVRRSSTTSDVSSDKELHNDDILGGGSESHDLNSARSRLPAFRTPSSFDNTPNGDARSPLSRFSVDELPAISPVSSRTTTGVSNTASIAPRSCPTTAIAFTGGCGQKQNSALKSASASGRQLPEVFIHELATAQVEIPGKAPLCLPLSPTMTSSCILSLSLSCDSDSSPWNVSQKSLSDGRNAPEGQQWRRQGDKSDTGRAFHAAAANRLPVGVAKTTSPQLQCCCPAVSAVAADVCRGRSPQGSTISSTPDDPVPVRHDGERADEMPSYFNRSKLLPAADYVAVASPSSQLKILKTAEEVVQATTAKGLYYDYCYSPPPVVTGKRTKIQTGTPGSNKVSEVQQHHNIIPAFYPADAEARPSSPPAATRHSRARLDTDCTPVDRTTLSINDSGPSSATSSRCKVGYYQGHSLDINLRAGRRTPNIMTVGNDSRDCRSYGGYDSNVISKGDIYTGRCAFYELPHLHASHSSSSSSRYCTGKESTSSRVISVAYCASCRNPQTTDGLLKHDQKKRSLERSPRVFRDDSSFTTDTYSLRTSSSVYVALPAVTSPSLSIRGPVVEKGNEGGNESSTTGLSHDGTTQRSGRLSAAIEIARLSRSLKAEHRDRHNSRRDIGGAACLQVAAAQAFQYAQSYPERFRV